jgi:hypothetical protein
MNPELMSVVVLARYTRIMVGLIGLTVALVLLWVIGIVQVETPELLGIPAVLGCFIMMLALMKYTEAKPL